MRGENVVSIFSSSKARPSRLAPTLKPIGAHIRLRANLLLDVVDTTGTSYVSLPFWKWRQADFLRTIILDFAGAGRHDAASRRIRRPDIICPFAVNGTENYEIVLGDEINRRIPPGRGLHRRSLAALHVARLAYETGVTNLDTVINGSVHFLNRPA